MPYINIMQNILTDYGMYKFLKTRYQKFNVDNDNRVYRFANHFDHTNVKVKVNLPDYYASL